MQTSISRRETFASAEASCLLSSSEWPHSSQLFLPNGTFLIDYFAEELHGKSYWVGLDHRDEDKGWTTSMGKQLSHDLMYGNITRADKDHDCAYIKSNKDGRPLISSSKCSARKRYVCQTWSLRVPWMKAEGTCPDGHSSYKGACLMAKRMPKNFEQAELDCGKNKGIMLPIRDNSMLQFVQTWAGLTVSAPIWIGMRKFQIHRVYDHNYDPPLITNTQNSLMYSDGQPVNLTHDTIGAALVPTKHGDCFRLNFRKGMHLEAYGCSSKMGYICMWQGADQRDKMTHQPESSGGGGEGK